MELTAQHQKIFLVSNFFKQLELYKNLQAFLIFIDTVEEVDHIIDNTTQNPTEPREPIAISDELAESNLGIYHIKLFVMR